MLNLILQNLGFSPIRETPKGYLFRSPFNPNERTPSFYVLRNDNTGQLTNFKDFSSSKGGDYYDFLMEYFHIDFKSAKEKLRELIGGNYQEPKRPTPIKASLSSFNQSKKSYEIKKVQPLQNRALIEYLREDRKISYEISKSYLEEIYYQIENKNYIYKQNTTDKQNLFWALQ
jgi:DNA primase